MQSVTVLNSKWNTKHKPSSFAAFLRHAELGHFTLSLQRTAKKCTKIYNARAQLMLCSLTFLFGDVLVVVVVVVCLQSSLIP